MIQQLTFREIVHGTPAYEETVALRAAVLRAPLGLEFRRQELSREYSQHHLACYQEEVLAGCLVLLPETDLIIKMRQLAVAPQSQRQGIGNALVGFSERFARGLNFTTMILHARETAVPFYEKLGYQCEGKRFEEVSLPHWKMRKKLICSAPTNELGSSVALRHPKARDNQ